MHDRIEKKGKIIYTKKVKILFFFPEVDTHSFWTRSIFFEIDINSVILSKYFCFVILSHHKIKIYTYVSHYGAIDYYTLIYS